MQCTWTTCHAPKLVLTANPALIKARHIFAMLPLIHPAFERGWRLFEGGIYSRKYGTSELSTESVAAAKNLTEVCNSTPRKWQVAVPHYQIVYHVSVQMLYISLQSPKYRHLLFAAQSSPQFLHNPGAIGCHGLRIPGKMSYLIRSSGHFTTGKEH